MANILDPVRNFAIVTLSSGYNDVATSVVLATGDGAKLPDPATEGSFNVVWWNATDYANPSDDPNKEIVRVTARSADTLTITRAQEGTSATTKNTAGKTYKMILAYTKEQRDKFETWALTEHNPDGTHNLVSMDTAPPNLLSNGNFINNSSNGYGGTPDDWVNSNANPVQGGIPALTKQNLIDITGLATADIELLLNLSGNFNDLSDNATNLTAGGSPTDDNDGLMGLAKKFVTASSQYASVTAPNVLVGGNQTWVILVKPTALPVTSSRYNLFGHSDSAYGVQCGIELVTDAANVSRFNFQLSGTTSNTQVTSDIIVQANKWYFVVGIFDSTNSLLKIYVNGILKSVTASGTHTTSGTQTVGVGRAGSFAGNYSSALMNMAIMISKALTDNQVKKLFAETMYKGIKLRRATTNAIAYQDLPMDLVERLRGKTVALRAEMYQEVASTSQISILQTLASGSTSETIISATDATTGSWLEKVATGAIDATAVGIRIQLKHSTTDGNTWFKKISLYEGSVLLPYDHSKNDWSRFPALLKQDFFDKISGYKNSGEVDNVVMRQGGSSSSWTTAGVVNYEESGVLIQVGSVAIQATNAFSGHFYADVSVTFPVAFSQIPLVFVTSQGATDGNPLGIAMSVTTTGCIIRGLSPNDANIAAEPVGWMAIGKR